MQCRMIKFLRIILWDIGIIHILEFFVVESEKDLMTMESNIATGGLQPPRGSAAGRPKR